MHPTSEQLQALEVEIEHTLHTLINLEIENVYSEMSKHFAKLLASVQSVNLIDYKLDVLVEPELFATETQILLKSLMEAKTRPNNRHKLLTHRMILKVWLRKNQRFTNEYLPQMF